ncbi:MAG: 4-alpha-glucanotransferase [Clostridia bacterium]|nr:4-alpha-glucanotransferase [Clostridia bacterium]MBQ9957474.1 4-alpha-glucanotransferase [Clostridia bacterium]
MRSSGILMHISSLPSRYGIGTFGKEAYRFADFLKKAGQSYWQILPICPTSYGDSPYQSFSAFAINPYFIDLDMLADDGLLKPEEFDRINWGNDASKVDYEIIYNNRYKVLKKAYTRFKKKLPADYDDFCTENSFWLDDYALFMAIKDANKGIVWNAWENGLKLRDKESIAKATEKYSDAIGFYKMQQYLCFKQWSALKEYVNSLGLKIIGDMPIYVSADSADVWSRPDQFLLDENGNPTEVAGCPPDAFSEDGQLWGNPLYDWARMEKEDFSWWCKRISFAFKVFDTLRIDHFRGFEAYYCIPYEAKTAIEGVWKKGPGMKLFNAIKKNCGDLPIIAEDLGYLTEDVRKLLKDSGFPGMKVLQFAFDSREESDYLPHSYDKNCVVYTGTHDNDTIMGWTKTAAPTDVEYARQYMHVNENDGFNWIMMKTAWASPADTAIMMMQDFMGLSSEARMNEPSTLGGNWQWRIDSACINDWLAGIIYENTKIYCRLPLSELKETEAGITKADK